MEVVEVVFNLLWCIVDVAIWSSAGSETTSSRRHPARSSQQTGRDTPIDADGLARFVSGSAASGRRGVVSILDPSTKSHPLRDRELDG